MNSFAIVESPAEGRRLHYLVMLISNVLGKNSAVDHQTLATRIQRMLEKDHPQQAPKVVAEPQPVTAPAVGGAQR